MPKIIVRGNKLQYGDLRFRCAIGKSGFSADKKEGDGCTPLGLFALRECWYRADRLATPETNLPLRPITPRDGWCDAPDSPRYNRHIVIPLLSQTGDLNPCVQIPSRELRSRMSQSQKTLWRHLQAPRFSSYGFHRQYCMNGRFIIIVCLDKMLIIEADGETHDDSAESRGRDAFLESEGFRILRFWNHEIAEDIEAVLDQIQKALAMQRSIVSHDTNASANDHNDHLSSHERLWRKEHVYDLVVPLGYNDNPVVPGKGSAIFLHIARDHYEPTEGCVALKQEDLITLLQRCDSSTVMEIKKK